MLLRDLKVFTNPCFFVRIASDQFAIYYQNTLLLLKACYLILFLEFPTSAKVFFKKIDWNVSIQMSVKPVFVLMFRGVFRIHIRDGQIDSIIWIF